MLHTASTLFANIILRQLANSREECTHASQAGFQSGLVQIYQSSSMPLVLNNMLNFSVPLWFKGGRWLGSSCSFVVLPLIERCVVGLHFIIPFDLRNQLSAIPGLRPILFRVHGEKRCWSEFPPSTFYFHLWNCDGQGDGLILMGK